MPAYSLQDALVWYFVWGMKYIDIWMTGDGKDTILLPGIYSRVAATRLHCNVKDMGSNPATTRNGHWETPHRRWPSGPEWKTSNVKGELDL